VNTEAVDGAELGRCGPFRAELTADGHHRRVACHGAKVSFPAEFTPRSPETQHVRVLAHYITHGMLDCIGATEPIPVSWRKVPAKFYTIRGRHSPHHPYGGVSLSHQLVGEQSSGQFWDSGRAPPPPLLGTGPPPPLTPPPPPLVAGAPWGPQFEERLLCPAYIVPPLIPTVGAPLPPVLALPPSPRIGSSLPGYGESWRRLPGIPMTATPTAAAGVDVNHDGRPDYIYVGADRNLDGIPDALQRGPVLTTTPVVTTPVDSPRSYRPPSPPTWHYGRNLGLERSALDVQDTVLEKGLPLQREVARVIPKRQYVELRHEVPKTEIQYVERPVEVPEIQYVEKIVEVPQVQVQEVVKPVPKVHVHEMIREVPRVQTQVVERVVDVPQVEYIDRVVEVPQVQYVERVVDVPQVQYQEVLHPVPRVQVEQVDRFVPRPMVQQVDRIVEVPEVRYVERIVEVPEVHLRETVRPVPRVEVVEQVRHVPKWEHQVVERVVEVPEVQYVEKVVEVPQVQFQEVIVPVPKPQVQEVVRHVPRYETQIVDRPVEVPQIQYVERQVEVPMVRRVDVPTPAPAVAPMLQPSLSWQFLPPHPQPMSPPSSPSYLMPQPMSPPMSPSPMTSGPLSPPRSLSPQPWRDLLPPSLLPQPQLLPPPRLPRPPAPVAPTIFPMHFAAAQLPFASTELRSPTPPPFPASAVWAGGATASSGVPGAPASYGNSSWTSLLLPRNSMAASTPLLAAAPSPALSHAGSMSVPPALPNSPTAAMWAPVVATAPSSASVRLTGEGSEQRHADILLSSEAAGVLKREGTSHTEPYPASFSGRSPL